jgi:hypothetical protein
MGRRPGSKNKPKTEPETASKPTKKATKKIGGYKTPVVKPVVPKGNYDNEGNPAAQPQADILGAINNLASFVQHGFQQFDERINAMENGRVTVPSVPAPEPAAVPGVAPALPPRRGTTEATPMIPDNTLEEPPSDTMLNIVELEGDAIMRSHGMDKAQITCLYRCSNNQCKNMIRITSLVSAIKKEVACPKCNSVASVLQDDFASLGRPAADFSGVVCYKCGRPAPPGYRVSQGDFTMSPDGNGMVFVHNSCHLTGK